MTGLYSRLFTYRPRPGRSPLEDFVTEAWVDLLNRMPSSQQLDFCTNVLLKNADEDKRNAWRDWAETSSDLGNLVWQTQVFIEAEGSRSVPMPSGAARKRPDIILFCDDKPLMLLENKIGAGFTSHGENGEADEKNQLQVYGEWLQNKTGGKGALVLLTAWTAAPPGFEDANAKYGVTARSVIRWNEIHKQLVSGNSDCCPERAPGGRTLADEFTEFLEEQGVIVRDPGEEDLKNAEMFFGEPYRRFYGAIENVGRRISLLLKSKGAGTCVGPKMSPSGLWFDQYVSFDSSSFWVGWGVRANMPEGDNGMATQLFAYVYTGMNSDHWDAILKSGKFARWDRPEPGQSEQSILLREIPVADLMSESEGFSSAFWHWVDPDGPSDKRVIAEALEIREIIQGRRNS